jgi:hypothetical protein
LALSAGGYDPVTAQSDLWAHASIQPQLRNAALTLQGSDVYKKVKPPGDTTLYKCALHICFAVQQQPSAAVKEMQLKLLRQLF